MRLPPLTAEQSLQTPSGWFISAATPAEACSIEPTLDFLCLLKCGTGVLKCISCGTNIGCWIACAGPEVVGCVTKCF